MGNGASELIDLIVRDSPSGSWKPGPSLTQVISVYCMREFKQKEET